MELRLPPEALAPATVTCSGRGQTIYEDEAQAARWGYWSDGVCDLYPWAQPLYDRDPVSAAHRLE